MINLNSGESSIPWDDPYWCDEDDSDKSTKLEICRKQRPINDGEIKETEQKTLPIINEQNETSEKTTNFIDDKLISIRNNTAGKSKNAPYDKFKKDRKYHQRFDSMDYDHQSNEYPNNYNNNLKNTNSDRNNAKRHYDNFQENKESFSEMPNNYSSKNKHNNRKFNRRNQNERENYRQNRQNNLDTYSRHVSANYSTIESNFQIELHQNRKNENLVFENDKEYRKDILKEISEEELNEEIEKLSINLESVHIETPNNEPVSKGDLQECLTNQENIIGNELVKNDEETLSVTESNEILESKIDTHKRPAIQIYNVNAVKGKWSSIFDDNTNEILKLSDQKSTQPLSRKIDDRNVSQSKQFNNQRKDKVNMPENNDRYQQSRNDAKPHKDECIENKRNPDAASKDNDNENININDYKRFQQNIYKKKHNNPTVLVNDDEKTDVKKKDNENYRVKDKTNHLNEKECRNDKKISEDKRISNDYKRYTHINAEENLTCTEFDKTNEQSSNKRDFTEPNLNKRVGEYRYGNTYYNKNENKCDNKIEQRQYRSDNRIDNRNENRSDNRYDSRNEYRKDNRYDNRNEYRNDNRHDNRNENRYDNKNDNRSDNKYDNRNDNRNENRHDNRNENRNDNRYNKNDSKNDNRSDNRYDNRNDNRNENRHDNRYDNRSDNRYDSKNDNRNDNGYDIRNDNKNENRHDNRNENRNDNRNDNRYDTKNDNRNDNRYDNRNDSRYDNRYDNKIENRNDNRENFPLKYNQIDRIFHNKNYPKYIEDINTDFTLTKTTKPLVNGDHHNISNDTDKSHARNNFQRKLEMKKPSESFNKTIESNKINDYSKNFNNEFLKSDDHSNYQNGNMNYQNNSNQSNKSFRNYITNQIQNERDRFDEGRKYPVNNRNFQNSNNSNFNGYRKKPIHEDNSRNI